MVAKPEFLGHFIFNSDYPTDKVVWLYEGQTTTPSSVTTKTVNINMADLQGTPLSIFVKGAWTRDNWASSYMIGSSRTATSSPDTYIGPWLEWNGDNLQLRISVSNSQGTSKTIKYRLWGVVRDDIQQAVDRPKNARATKSKLIFNSELNYPRLYKDGIAKSGDVIEHNLGKIPYMDCWRATTSTSDFSRYWIYRSNSGGFGSSNTSPCVRATEKDITFVGSGERYYYRIYA